jgi:hypothetical protein
VSPLGVRQIDIKVIHFRHPVPEVLEEEGKPTVQFSVRHINGTLIRITVAYSSAEPIRLCVAPSDSDSMCAIWGCALQLFQQILFEQAQATTKLCDGCVRDARDKPLVWP